MSETYFDFQYAQGEELMLSMYPEVVSYLRQIYATDDVIGETDAALTRFIQRSTVW